MMKYLLYPIRLAIKACKGTALVLALIMMVVLLLPKTGEAYTACPHELENADLRQIIASQDQELAQLRLALDTQYELCRRIDLRFFGQDWLTLRTVDFWNSVSYSHYASFPEDTQETVWTSAFLELIFTTVERRTSNDIAA